MDTESCQSKTKHSRAILGEHHMRLSQLACETLFGQSDDKRLPYVFVRLFHSLLLTPLCNRISDSTNHTRNHRRKREPANRSDMYGGELTKAGTVLEHVDTEL